MRFRRFPKATLGFKGLLALKETLALPGLWVNRAHGDTQGRKAYAATPARGASRAVQGRRGPEGFRGSQARQGRAGRLVFKATQGRADARGRRGRKACPERLD
jgi:hypothetical protein